MRPARVLRCDEAVDEAAEGEGDEQRSGPIEMAAGGGAAFGNMPQRNNDDDDGEGEIDEEDPSPGSMLDEPAAENGPEGGGDGGETGPCADGLAAAGLIEGGTDNGEAAGDEERGADSLNAAGEEKL